MIFYGLMKVSQIQFVLPGSVYELSLKALDGVTLAWAFLGYSSWFSFLLGAFELIPGVLLLFRKTSLLGAILILPSVLSIFLINMAYGFLFQMQLLTGVLLLIDLGLLLMNKEALKQMLIQIIHSKMRETLALEFIVNIVLTGFLVLIILFTLA
jgi:hypothetical protein